MPEPFRRATRPENRIAAMSLREACAFPGTEPGTQKNTRNFSKPRNDIEARR